jgi:hypothetical protein
MDPTRIYSNLRRLDVESGHRRIFAPESYAVPRNLRVVPIVDGEAGTLAAFFPICWQSVPDGVVLCALRSLLPDGHGHPIRPTHASGALPQILRAYPVAALPGRSREEVFIDDVPADKPTDPGAPIRGRDGKPSAGAIQRVRAAMAVRAGAARTAELSAALLAGNMLEPWPLRFPIDDRGSIASVEDLMVVRPGALDGGDLPALLRRFGIRAAMLIALHRASLFRISALVDTARAAARDTARPILGTAA